jgi:hypothetical protein
MSRDDLLALVLAQAQTIAAQQEMIGQLQATVVRLEARVAGLERQLGRNSGNSSMPPSLDGQPGHTPPPDKPQRSGPKRRPGKQTGAPGSGLAWRESPDETREHFPTGRRGCGADLAGATDLGVAAAHWSARVDPRSGRSDEDLSAPVPNVAMDIEQVVDRCAVGPASPPSGPSA